MNSVILDASAALAVLWHERGKDVVKRHVPGAIMSAVNVAEVVSKLADTGMNAAEARSLIDTLGLEVASFDEELAHATGMLRPSTRRKGLSLGDRACLALAKQLALPALTADRGWTELDVSVEIKLIRE